MRRSVPNLKRIVPENWQDRVKQAVLDGCEIVTPNGLPVRCMTATGKLLEIENGDHSTYIFPVIAEYTGEITQDQFEDYRMQCGEAGDPVTSDKVRGFMREHHALIYTDGVVALTLYECNYAMWIVGGSEHDGRIEAGSMWKACEWKLSEQSMADIKAYLALNKP